MISEETRAYYDLKKRNDIRESAKKHDRWHAFINFQGKHYNLGTHPTFQSAVKARRAAEERLHDPAIIAHIETLTEERRKEFAMYLRNNGGTI